MPITPIMTFSMSADPERLAVARQVASYELGDPQWADMLILAYLDPGNALFDEALDR